MVIARGDLYWVDLAPPSGSGPGFRRPVAIVSADAFNRSHIATVLAVTISSNTALAAAPGNVRLERGAGGLRRESVVNVSQLITLDKRELGRRIGRLPLPALREVDAGLRLVLDVGLDPGVA